MNFDFTQFNLDCPRMVIFIDEEWIPSSEPSEVWTRLLEVFDNDETIAFCAAKYCTQIPLANHYIQEVIDMHMFHVDEHLLSHNYHVVVINSTTKLLEVKKDFVQSYIKDGEEYQMDYCNLKIIYNPADDNELSVTWNYIVHGLRDDGRKSRILLDSSVFSAESDFV